MELRTDEMVTAMNNALSHEWKRRKGSDIPDVGKEDRELLFAGIARGFLEYFKSNEGHILSSITLKQSSKDSITHDVETVVFNHKIELSREE